MEGFSERTNLQGLPPWPRKLISVRPLGMAPSMLPLLAPSSFQFWKKPYFSNPDDSLADNHNKYRDSSPQSDENLDTFVTPLSSDYPVKPEIVCGRSGRNQLDPNMDPKKLKRIISNRVSAQKSRMKKLQYVTEMERKAKALEVEIAVLRPQVVRFKNQQHLLQMEQKKLNQEVSGRANNKSLKDAEIEENKAEVNRLRQLHLAQQQQNMQGQQMLPTWNEHGFEQIINESFVQSTGTEHLVFINSNLEQIDENIEEIDEWSKKQELAQTWISTLSTSLLVWMNFVYILSSAFWWPVIYKGATECRY
eukprot:XP_015573025.1 basic leucine zipper 34-like isoform X2 [Ricinus communis]